MHDRLLKTSEVAKILSVGMNAVRQLCESGQLRALRSTPSGKHFRIPESAIQEFLKSREVVPKTTKIFQSNVPGQSLQLKPLKLCERYPILAEIGVKI